jgi:putative transcriptional regulator
MTEYLLRDLKRNTELLILAEYLRNPSVKRKEIAERLGVTEQAVSQYISDLEKESLLTVSKGRTKPSRKGIQLLQERFFQLNEEIKGILRQIQVIDTCVAVAAAPIKDRERVGLIMRRGRLEAVPKTESASMGVARSDAKKGEEVLVGSLEGVVELELGGLLVLQLPSETSGGSRNIDSALALKAMKGLNAEEVAVGDVIGEVVADHLGIRPTLVHAPVQATMNALSKGVDVLFLGTYESAEEMLRAVERLKNQTGYSITHRVIDVGKK